jgi:DNA-binding transcriptional ArsR family regulator
MATPESQRGADRDPIGPLTHPLRRRILRYLHSCGEPRGASEVAAALDESISQIKYHLRTLKSFTTIKEAGFAPVGDSPLYESTVSANAEVLALLEANEADEEGREAA